MIYQSVTATTRNDGKKARALSLRGNGKFGNVTRSGWEPCNLGTRKQKIAEQALKMDDTDRVWRVGTSVYRLTMNGKTIRIA